MIAFGVIAGSLPAAAAAEADASRSAQARAAGCAVTALGERNSYTNASGTHSGIKVTIYWNPCSRPVRARVHCNDFPFGTYYLRGNTD